MPKTDLQNCVDGNRGRVSIGETAQSAAATLWNGGDLRSVQTAVRTIRRSVPCDIADRKLRGPIRSITTAKESKTQGVPVHATKEYREGM